MLGVKMPCNAQSLPVVQLLPHRRSDLLGLETERIAAEVNAVFSRFRFRNMELLAELGKLVFAVKAAHVVGIRLVFRYHNTL